MKRKRKGKQETGSVMLLVQGVHQYAFKDTGQRSTGWSRHWQRNRTGSTLPWRQVFSVWSSTARVAPNHGPWRTAQLREVFEIPVAKNIKVEMKASVKFTLFRKLISTFNYHIKVRIAHKEWFNSFCQYNESIWVKINTGPHWFHCMHKTCLNFFF